jgi:protein transport protein SEC13
VPAHQIGVNAVSWAPAAEAASLTTASAPVKRFVTGGCDNLVKVVPSSSADLVADARQPALAG